MNYQIPKLEKCDLYEVCEQFDNIYGMCEECDITSNRCTPAEKAQIYLLFKIAKKLNALEDIE